MKNPFGKSEKSKQEASSEDTKQLEEWDKKYVLSDLERGRDYQPKLVVGGKGCYIWDSDGNRYLDFFAQTWNVNIGHGNLKVIGAIRKQAEELAYVTPTKATRVRAKLAKKIIDLMPEGLSKCTFHSGGSEAVELAIKMAKEYTGKYKVISRWYAYHGGTAGALSAGGLPARRSPFEPLLPGFVHVPPPYCYRCKFGLQYPDCGIRCVEFIDETIKFEDPERVAAVIAETVIGSGGVMIPPPEYWPRLREITRKHGVVLIADEVITGFGRTGKWFAVEHWNVVPDMMTLAKGLSSGYLPVSATVVNGEIAQFYEREPLMHLITYQNHPLCLAAALANIEVLEEEKLVENAAKVGRHLRDRLKELEESHKSVGETRSLGLLAGVELVKNKGTKEPFVDEDLFLYWRRFDPKYLVAEKVVAKAYKMGLIVSAFKSANTIRISPPLCITEDEVDKGIDILDEALKEADAQVGN